MTQSSRPSSNRPSSGNVQRRCILVCQNRSCVGSGSEAVLSALQTAAPDGVLISASACLGQCAAGPTVQVNPDNVWYCRVKPEDATDIAEQHLRGDRPVERLLHPRFHPRFDATNYS